VIGELVEASFAPTQGLDVPVKVDVIGALSVTVVTNPPLVGIFAGAPLHERGFPDPGVVIVLRDAAIFGVVRGVEGLGVALREHNDVRVGQGGAVSVAKPAKAPSSAYRADLWVKMESST